MIETTNVHKFLREVQQKESCKHYNIVFVGEDGVGKEFYAKEIHRFRKKKEKFMVVDLEVEPSLQKKQLKCVVDQGPESFLQQAKQHTYFFRRLDILERHLLLQLVEFFRKVCFCTSQRKLQFLELGLLSSVEERKLNQANTLLVNLLAEFFLFGVKISPLRERKSEIIDFAKKIISDYHKKASKNILGFSPESENILANYCWPGNLNELQSVLEGACLLNNGEKLITPAVLPLKIPEDTVSVKSNNPVYFFDEKKGGAKEKCQNLIACCSYYS